LILLVAQNATLLGKGTPGGAFLAWLVGGKRLVRKKRKGPGKFPFGGVFLWETLGGGRVRF